MNINKLLNTKILNKEAKPIVKDLYLKTVSEEFADKDIDQEALESLLEEIHYLKGFIKELKGYLNEYQQAP